MQAFQRSSLDLRVAGRPRAPGGHNDPLADIAGGAKSPLESQNCTRFLNRPISTVLTPPLTTSAGAKLCVVNIPQNAASKVDQWRRNISFANTLRKKCFAKHFCRSGR